MRYPQWLVDELISKITPTGQWADFNDHMQYYRYLQSLLRRNYLYPEDMPEEPKPCDYHLDPPCTDS